MSFVLLVCMLLCRINVVCRSCWCAVHDCVCRSSGLCDCAAPSVDQLHVLLSELSVNIILPHHGGIVLVASCMMCVYSTGLLSAVLQLCSGCHTVDCRVYCGVSIACFVVVASAFMVHDLRIPS